MIARKGTYQSTGGESGTNKQQRLDTQSIDYYGINNNNNSNSNGKVNAKLESYQKLKHFARMQLQVNRGKIRKRHGWRVMMFGPMDMEELLNAEGISVDDVEELSDFYNAHLKDK